MRPRAVVVASVLGAQLAVADPRAFVHTVEYSAQPEGTTSVQLWHTQRRADWDPITGEAFEQVLEIEHGVTERFDAGVRTHLAQEAGGALRFDRVALQARYRFADRAVLPTDPLIAVELAKQFGSSVYRTEVRGVVARAYDRMLVAANATLAVEFGGDVMDVEPVVGWAAGAGYLVHDALRLGAETWGEASQTLPTLAFAGPVVHISPTPRLWLAVGAGLGVSEAADVYNVRAILGFELD